MKKKRLSAKLSTRPAHNISKKLASLAAASEYVLELKAAADAAVVVPHTNNVYSKSSGYGSSSSRTAAAAAADDSRQRGQLKALAFLTRFFPSLSRTPMRGAAYARASGCVLIQKRRKKGCTGRWQFYSLQREQDACMHACTPAPVREQPQQCM